jgi:NAD(P)-dependent dehydrogenase (short-subunit alcohol dehydrogenase family)
MMRHEGKVAIAKNIRRRLPGPQEVANMAAFLASHDAKGVTGQAINVCGNFVLIGRT